MIDSAGNGVYTQETLSFLPQDGEHERDEHAGRAGDIQPSTLHFPISPHGQAITETKPATSGAATGRSELSRIVAGEFEPTAFTPVSFPANRLAPAEAAAVARVLGCPDLFLLDAAERTVRERILLQFLRQAVGTGERILVLSPDPAAVDRMAELLAADGSLRIVRALAEDENPIRPTPHVTRLTGCAVAGRAEQLQRDAAQLVRTLEGRIQRLDRAETLHRKLEELEMERSALADRIVAIENEARSQPPDEVLEELARLHERRAKLVAERTELERTRPGLLSRLFGGNRHASQWREIDGRIQQLEAEIESFRCRQTSTSSEEMVAGIAARLQSFAPRQEELEAEIQRIERELHEVLPRATVDDTVENGATTHTARLKLERELTVARTRLQELNEAGTDLPRRLLAQVQVVVGTPGSLDNDAVYSAVSTPFDRLVLDHAEELSEAALERLAPLATRWVLAGDAAPPAPVAHSRTGRSRLNEPSLFCRLAGRFDREPWCFEAGRLVVRRAHLVNRSALLREPLLDHPDVELGLSATDEEPVLAEIAFPEGTAIPAAKSFLFTQLGEVVLRPCGEPVWHSGADRLTACWPMLEVDGEWVELETGVRELVVGHGLAAFTGAVSFDPACWDEDSARTWLESRIPPQTSRVARLPCEARVPRPAISR